MYNNTIYKEYKDVNCNNKKVLRVPAAAILIRWRLGAGEWVNVCRISTWTCWRALVARCRRKTSEASTRPAETSWSTSSTSCAALWTRWPSASRSWRTAPAWIVVTWNRWAWWKMPPRSWVTPWTMCWAFRRSRKARSLPRPVTRNLT